MIYVLLFMLPLFLDHIWRMYAHHTLTGNRIAAASLLTMSVTILLIIGMSVESPMVLPLIAGTFITTAIVN